MYVRLLHVGSKGTYPYTIGYRSQWTDLPDVIGRLCPGLVAFEKVDPVASRFTRSCSLALHFVCKESYALCVQNPLCRTWFRLRISSLWPPSFLQTTTSYIILHLSHKDQNVWRTNAMNAERLSLLNARSKCIEDILSKVAQALHEGRRGWVSGWCWVGVAACVN